MSELHEHILRVLKAAGPEGITSCQLAKRMGLMLKPQAALVKLWNEDKILFVPASTPGKGLWVYIPPPAEPTPP